jgi:CheY-like chemotaxis protein
LVEDEAGVRTLTRHVLNGCGYRVLEAADGDEAVRVASGHTEAIHLLITDVVMPGIGGRVVAERITERHPEARVLFVSGYTDDAILRHGVSRELVHFLPKPYSPLVLACKTRELLDAQA